MTFANPQWILGYQKNMYGRCLKPRKIDEIFRDFHNASQSGQDHSVSEERAGLRSRDRVP
jgi:hypothetical protein